MKTKRMLMLVPVALLFTGGCETQDGPLPVAYRPVMGAGGSQGEVYRTYAYDPYYDYSGAIFPYKDFYWYGRPPFYVKGAPLRKFDADNETAKPVKKASPRAAVRSKP